MTEPHSPQRRSFTAKTVFGLLLAVVMVGAFATAGCCLSPERTAARDEGVLCSSPASPVGSAPSPGRTSTRSTPA